MKRIRKDRVSDRLTELAMLHNPQSQKPKELFKTLQNQLQTIDGKGYLGKEKMTPQDERKLREIAELMKSNAIKRRNS